MFTAESCCRDETMLTFETMLTDPLIRMVMASDGVTVSDMVEVLTVARRSLARREIATTRALTV